MNASNETTHHGQEMEDRADTSEHGVGCCGGESDGFRLVWAGSVASGVLFGGCRLHGWISILGYMSASIGICALEVSGCA